MDDKSKAATGTDRAAGIGMISVAGGIFVYYTIWVIILPFVDASHVVHSYFLPRTYALAIPLIAGVIGLLGIGCFVGMVMMKSSKKKKS